MTLFLPVCWLNIFWSRRLPWLNLRPPYESTFEYLLILSLKFILNITVWFEFVMNYNTYSLIYMPLLSYWFSSLYCKSFCWASSILSIFSGDTRIAASEILPNNCLMYDSKLTFFIWQTWHSSLICITGGIIIEIWFSSNKGFWEIEYS